MHVALCIRREEDMPPPLMRIDLAVVSNTAKKLRPRAGRGRGAQQKCRGRSLVLGNSSLGALRDSATTEKLVYILFQSKGSSGSR
jgi:hypothetical protein